MSTYSRFLPLAAAIEVAGCGISSPQSSATRPADATPSAAQSVAPALKVTATAEDSTGKPPPAGAVVVTAANLKFDPPSPTATGTRVLIYLDNKDSATPDCQNGSDVCHHHGVVVLGPGGVLLGSVDAVAPGRQAVLTLDGMRPGQYKFYCPVFDHKYLGMAGVLKVS